MGKFTFTQTQIPGVVVIEPQVFGDDRGYFMETYQKDQFAEAGIDKEFVQDNQSRSTRGVLRGLHAPVPVPISPDSGQGSHRLFSSPGASSPWPSPFPAH